MEGWVAPGCSISPGWISTFGLKQAAFQELLILQGSCRATHWFVSGLTCTCYFISTLSLSLSVLMHEQHHCVSFFCFHCVCICLTL